MWMHRNRRRGVVLLVALTLLTLFTLLTVALAIVASHARQSSVAGLEREQKGDPPDAILNSALLQVVRGSTSAGSAIGPHSLLEDKYGNQYVAGTFSALTAWGGLLETTAPSNGWDAVSNSPDEVPGYYAGRVLTVTTGAQRNRSTRIVSYEIDGAGAYRMRMLPFPGGAVPATGDQFVINGQEFGGRGFGFSKTALRTNKLLNAMLPISTTTEAGLSPNPSDSEVATFLRNTPSEMQFNEAWDAADLQNLFLGTQDPVLLNASSQYVNLPSFHRPDLIRYWMQRTSQSTFEALALAQPSLVSKIMLRPYSGRRADGTLISSETAASFRWHPNFTGGNPNFDPLNGPWDVDNDGDGVPDSVWIDIGLPVQATRDGRLYKPLAAILCVDMDGRLNVNANGNLEQALLAAGDSSDSIVSILADDEPADPRSKFTAALGGQANNTARMARGGGSGPIETDLGTVFTAAEHLNLMIGTGTTPGRNGGTPGDASAARPGLNGVDDNYASYAQQPGILAGNLLAVMPNMFNNPRGRATFALDQRGQPLLVAHGVAGDQIDDDYEINLQPSVRNRRVSTDEGVDAPFKPAELERLLRFNDVDSRSLPSRLLELCPTTLRSGSGAALNRRMVTTESWDAPIPNISIPEHLLANLRDQAFGSLRLSDLISARLALEGFTNTGPAMASGVRGLLGNGTNAVLWPDVAGGIRFDVNRRFGNDADDNSNGVIDEGLPGETETIYAAPFQAAFNHLNSTTAPVAGHGILARLLYARHLYVLTMALLDPAYVPPGLPGGYSDDQRKRAVARMCAQFAVNAVDFRDRDAICTPFEYDVFPFADNAGGDNNPWDVDGALGAAGTGDNSASYRGLVWGCERPELLLTETLAGHDRRTEDLTTDPTGKNTSAPTDPDDDFDQAKRPRGFLFIEMYNPWGMSRLNPTTNGWDQVLDPRPELYDTNLTGVDLKKVTSNGTPVWRIAITKKHSDSQFKDPDDPEISEATRTGLIDRTIYFTTARPAVTGDGSAFYLSSVAASQAVAPVAPGRYVVVGPGNDTPEAGLGVGETVISDRSDSTTITDSRIIRLDPTANPQVNVLNNYDGAGAAATYPSTSTAIKAPIAAVIGQPYRLSATEPAGGEAYYQAIDPTMPLDTPLDKARATANAEWNVLNLDGTTQNFRRVHLQRLANPLVPWNADTNPYLTIDTMPLDVTAYNGVENDQVGGGRNAYVASGAKKLTTRERGLEAVYPLAIWAQDPGTQAVANAVAENPVHHKYAYHLQHTLGYLNQAWGQPASTSTAKNGGSSNQYVGEPDSNSPAYPWLSWFDRPFVSGMELMLVPTVRSSQLGLNFSLWAETAAGGVPVSSPYRFDVTAGGVLAQPFRHLLPFFQARIVTDSAAVRRPEFHRLLDFVHVPSKFAGSETVFTAADVAATASSIHGFQVPFNRVSNYRDPGKINLNTIYQKPVFQALFGGLLPQADLDQLWARFQRSRRGTATAGLEPTLPTWFANPFRPAGSNNEVPLAVMKQPLETDVTLMRRDPVELAAGRDKPLFGFDSVSVTDTSAGGARGGHNDPNRHAYFRYQLLSRLANLTTIRSNVYACWITVGYFEVQAINDRTNYTDGFRLGRELGLDRGEVRRNRGFYLIDRSLPVGFIRGQNLNVEECILLRRVVD